MRNKCKDVECQRRNACKRFTELSETEQQFFEVSPRWKEECDSYISNGMNVTEQREEVAEEKRSFMHDVMN